MKSEEDLFGQIALRLGFIDQATLDECLAAALERGCMVGQVLVLRGHLTRPQVRKILRRQGKEILSCVECDRRYNVRKYRSDSTYACKRCGGKLVSAAPDTEPFFDEEAGDSAIVRAPWLTGNDGPTGRFPMPRIEGGRVVVVRVIDVGNGRPALDDQNLDVVEMSLDGLREAGHRFFCVDFAGIKHVASRGLSYLLAFSDQVAASGGGIALSCLDEKVRSVMSTFGILDLFPTFASSKEAVAHLLKS